MPRELWELVSDLTNIFPWRCGRCNFQGTSRPRVQRILEAHSTRVDLRKAAAAAHGSRTSRRVCGAEKDLRQAAEDLGWLAAVEARRNPACTAQACKSQLLFWICCCGLERSCMSKRDASTYFEGGSAKHRLLVPLVSCCLWGSVGSTS